LRFAANQPKLRDLLFLGSLQQRIVAKVDELMALCDKLEAQQQEQITLREITRSSVFNALTTAETISDLRTSWYRLDGNIHLLLQEPEDIEQFKIMVLELAISGKLNERESSASLETLERMQARKRSLVKSKLIKGDSPVVDFSSVHDLRVDIPKTWIWCRLNDIASVVRGGSPRPAGDPRFYDGKIPFLKVADITQVQGMFVENFTYTIKEEGLSKTREITQRTVLLTNSGATLGIPTICTFRATFNDGIAAFVELDEEVFDEYLYFYLKAKSKWLLDIASRGQPTSSELCGSLCLQ
jgi:type I restriction enzyme S subunit